MIPSATPEMALQEGTWYSSTKYSTKSSKYMEDGNYSCGQVNKSGNLIGVKKVGSSV